MADEKDPKKAQGRRGRAEEAARAAPQAKPLPRRPSRRPLRPRRPRRRPPSSTSRRAETAAERAAGTTPAAKPTRCRKAAAAKAAADDDAAEDKPKPARRTRRKAEPDPPAAPAAKPKRAAARLTADGPPMVRAHAKYVRTSARKARLVCDHIRGKSVDEARAILAHASRDVARDWSKLLESAVANAEHNHELIGDDLRIHAVKADEGPTLKRFRPRAMGRATKIRKRTSHLSITLTPKDGE